MKRKRASILLLSLICPAIALAETKPATDVNWKEYIAAQDLHWDRLPQRWHDAPFAGNGLMGTMMFQTSPTTLVIQVGRGDVQDHRFESGKESLNNVLPDSSRLPIGYFTLETESPITGGEFRVNLYDAEITGTLKTENGALSIRALIPSHLMLLAVEVKAVDGSSPYQLVWHPEEAFCPRVRGGRAGGKAYREGYVPNPLPVVDKDGDIQTCRQDLLAGGQTGTAWTIREEGTSKLLLASVGHSFPETNALADAVAVVKQARSTPLDELVAKHRTWWHDFYQRSFVSLPDQRLNSFYWIQNYKMACATKGGQAIADNQGPWLQPTGWPALWWNLNVQLAYSHLPTANHPDLAAGLVENLYKHRKNLSANVPDRMGTDSMAINTVSGQDLNSPIDDPLTKKNIATGNLLWALHNCYMQYRHTMDDALLREKILPLLKPAVNFYLNFTIEKDDGKIHLPNTNSPEYDATGAEDCNYDLALLRWGCATLIDSCRRLKIDDPMIPRWQDVLDRLAPYPTNDTGYMIGKDVPYARSHRHYSHLLMIYPLYLINVDQPESRELIKRSVDHWQSLPEKLAGYSYTGSASMYASLGLGGVAEKRMQDFMNDKVLPNTFYAEGSPVIETPPAGARSLQDMLLQSWGDTIRVFPAMPDHWKEASYARLSAEGAFLVSAVRRDGRTAMIKIESQAGEPCKVATGMTAGHRVIGLDAAKVTDLGNGVLSLRLDRGESVTILDAREAEPLPIKPVKPTEAADWTWGLNRTTTPGG